MALRFAEFELDGERAELRTVGGEAIKLRPKTFALLELFAANANRLLSKQELMSAIWPNIHVGEDSLFQCVREIRTALRDERRQLVKSVSGRGYLFDTDVVSDKAPAAPVIQATPQDSPVTSLGARSGRLKGIPRPIAIPLLVVCLAVIVALSTPMILRDLFPSEIRAIAIAPIQSRSGDQGAAAMAANVTDRLTDGLSKISNIRVIAPRGSADAEKSGSPAPDYFLRGDIQRGSGGWEIQARLIDATSGQVQWSNTASTPTENIDETLQQSRLAASIGYPLALRINALAQTRLPSADGKIIAGQAAELINQTNRERFAAAQQLLEKGLTAHPNDIDIEAALASHLLRGIQMVWYSPAETEKAWQRARTLLESVLLREPNYIPALQAYCRLLINTNDFVDSLVACKKSLSFQPWDGLALFHMGMAQLQLGRFEDALRSFQRADSYDTPAVSRWTWLLGAGVALVYLERPLDAVSWLQRSLAITSATGRTHMTLALAYAHLGKISEAKEALQKGLQLRPDSNPQNVSLPPKNNDARFRDQQTRFMKELVALGLPER